MTDTSPELDPKSAVCLGLILGAQGLKGELRVQPLTDFPERFQHGASVWIDAVPYRVEGSRYQDKSVVLKLDGFDSRSAAEALSGKELMAPEALPIEEEDRYYLHDVIGLRVEDVAGETLGKVADVFPTGSNDVFVIEGERGQLLLPAIEDAIKQVDIAGGRVVVEMLPGLDFIAPTVKKPRPPRPVQVKGKVWPVNPPKTTAEADTSRSPEPDRSAEPETTEIDGDPSTLN